MLCKLFTFKYIAYCGNNVLPNRKGRRKFFPLRAVPIFKRGAIKINTSRVSILPEVCVTSSGLWLRKWSMKKCKLWHACDIFSIRNIFNFAISSRISEKLIYLNVSLIENVYANSRKCLILLYNAKINYFQHTCTICCSLK